MGVHSPKSVGVQAQNVGVHIPKVGVQTLGEVQSDWRIEISWRNDKKGKRAYFRFVTGRGKDRKIIYGGKLDKLSQERIEKYVTNTRTSREHKEAIRSKS